ncbi:glycine-rich protein [Tanacetum coccineum]
MDKSWMNIVHRLSDPRYELGVMKFLDFAYRDKDRSLEIPCPCKICHNFCPQKKDVVYSHLMQKGISLDYIRWTEHGETSTSLSEDYVDDGEDDTLIDESNDMSHDDFDDMLDNLGQNTWGDGWKTSGKSEGRFDKDLETLHRLLDDSQQALYQGCPTYSKFSFAVTILHLKTMSGMSNRSFDVMLGVFRKALPTPSLVPKNFYEAKNTLYDVPVHMEDKVYQEEEPNLNLIIDLNIHHASLTRGNTPLELVDASTFFVGESSRQSRRTHYVTDEEFIGDDDDYDVSASSSDDDDVDATNSNSSQEDESCDDDDLTHTATSNSSEKEDSFQDDDYISSD